MVFRRFSTNSTSNKGQQQATAAPSSASNSARSPSTRNSLPNSDAPSARRTSLAGSMSGLSLAGSTGGASTTSAPPPYRRRGKCGREGGAYETEQYRGSSKHLENVIDTKVVAKAFREIEPFGSTPTGVVMDEILRDYVERVEDARQTKERVKPLLLLVLTDGRADDTDLVRDVIVEMAQRLDEVRAPPFQLGIQFIQIGDDPDARAFLQELDDDLKPQLGVRDMVDTTPYEGHITPEFLLKAALGAVVKSIDG
ncbi:hypothetical protein Rt10032_c09g3794 [Rhodotorula toruloides]|uniref:VWFA domain-containing protein n=1 Tax=Rhodotorula toruloides TaxID=5286 RepID=A0A511KHD6_RHOTO|nr:hypothetical protein Rt10032_c09g3794 [Rhodotorula toruloides]